MSGGLVMVTPGFAPLDQDLGVGAGGVRDVADGEVRDTMLIPLPGHLFSSGRFIA